MANTDLNNDGKISFFEAFPYWFDRLRLFPRAFISMYIWMLYRVTEWFMALPDPSMPQAGLVSVVVGAGAAWFGLYVNSTSENSGKIIVQTDTSTSGTKASYSGSASAEADYEPREIKSRY
jgi:uncharacterized BrkB/YihY/UPF0761 family membrane protein|tara:strand:+ start:153 stop:515 length:363 start_codon:yes stop_codon:yes gene_type:complete